MRRADKQVVDLPVIEGFLRDARVCHLAICHEDAPYVVPLNFGYRAGTLYFHSAPEGRKIDLLRNSPRVAFAVTLEDGLAPGETACAWSMHYRSVLGTGRLRFIETPEEKRAALDVIMRQYSDNSFRYPDSSVAATLVFAVEIESMTGKCSPGSL